MEVRVAKSAGFCYGVANAVNTVYKNLDTAKICTLGQVVHNKKVTSDIERRGARAVERVDEIRPDETAVIRAHGVAPEVYREFEARGVAYIDCTCRDVRKIHNIVAENSAAGRFIIIAGDAAHPEIIGIAGFAGSKCRICENFEEIQNFVFEKNEKYAIVAQTTFLSDVYNDILCYISKLNVDINIYDTICKATANRQREAAQLAAWASKMIVIGDKNSSNSTKLYSICKNICQYAIFIETINDLQLNIFNADDKIGITAGASTSPDILKEALFFMSELENAKNNQSFEEMLDESFVTLHTGDVVKGTVIQVANGEVSVNLGYKSDGIIPRHDVTDDPTAVIEDLLKPGDVVEVYVVRVNDGEGNVQLSKKKIDAQKNYVEIEQAFADKTPMQGKIIDLVKGGLIALINGVRVFVPSSQISNRYVEDLTVFKGKELDFNILEYDRAKRRIVAGRKELATLEQTRNKERVFSSLEIGSRVTGVVSRIVDFGAFVDLGGIDGLIHISELSWGRVKKVKDVLAVGDTVTVNVLELDKEKGKISLSLKDISNDPWTSVPGKFTVGDIVEGKVVRMVPFGAFVELADGIDALIHISQIANRHIAKPDDVLKIGEVVKVKITEIDLANKKISLSKKEADGLGEATPEAETAADTDMPEEVASDEAAPAGDAE